MTVAALHDVIASLAAIICAQHWLTSDNASYSPACKAAVHVLKSARTAGGWRRHC